MEVQVIKNDVSPNLEELELEYVASLNERQHRAYLIAQSHLGSLFTVHKTNGFLQWMASRK